MTARARVLVALAPTLAAALSVGAWPARAQNPAPPTPPTTVGFLEQLVQTLLPPPPPAPPPAPAAPAPAPAPGGSDPAAPGDATTSTSAPEPGVVPPDAQRVIDAVFRTPGQNTLGLLEALRPLADYGLSPEETAVLGMGRFPVAGEAYYTDDWLMPRFTPTFHFHMGTDVFAARGTPVRSPDEGVVTFTEEAVGGKSAYVTARDGTYYYMTHLDGFAPDLPSGSPVGVGTVVGFVGSTGNAQGGSPHLHLQIHPGGGAPVNPKPFLDQWLAEAIANIPKLLASYQVGLPRPLTAAGMLRRFDTGSFAASSGSVDGPQLWTATVRSTPEGIKLTQAPGAAEDVVAELVALNSRRADDDWRRADELAAAVIGPVTPRVLGGPGAGGSSGGD